MFLRLAFGLYLLSILSVASSDIVAVYSLQRHGARNVLAKGLLLQESNLAGGPTLLSQGQRQTYNAGVAFRTRYLNFTTCSSSSTCLVGANSSSSSMTYGVYGTPGIAFGNWNVYLRSSSLDRAVLSGLCFFNGIFPADPTAGAATDRYLPTGAQMVPVYTQSDAEDLLIRAYTKCDAYQATLVSWFRSEEFQAKSAQTSELRQQVAAAMPDVDTQLANWWNVYDAINVYRTYGVGSPTPAFNDTMFAKIQELAYWLETAKMRSSLARSLLGGVALADLGAYLQAAAEAAAAGSPAYYKLVSLSGHYNTQLGLLAALQLDTWAPAANFTWFRSIPKLAALMVFELHSIPASSPSAPSSFYVRLVAQDGPSAAYATIPLPCASAAAAAALSSGACSLQDFLSYAAARAFNSSAAWCTACNNTGVTACQLAAAQQNVLQLQQQLAGSIDNTGTASDSGSGGGVEAWKIAVSVVVTFVGTMLLVGLGVAVWAWRERAGAGSGASGAAGVKRDGAEGHAGHSELVFTQLGDSRIGNTV